MSFAKEQHDDYLQFDDLTKHITEKAVCYALEERGVRYGTNYELHKVIDNIPFTKRKKHEVDFLFKSSNGGELYVEIKGQMTYMEVNKLRFLLEYSNLDFYILQLTEIDWIKPYKANEFEREFQKSKEDFYTQIEELIGFVNGNVTGEELSKRSITVPMSPLT